MTDKGVDMRTTPHICGYCGKRSGKFTESVRLIEPGNNVIPYAGNLRVLRRTSHQHGADNVLTESYRDHRYGAFCTLVCARKFANVCYDSGMRMIHPDVPESWDVEPSTRQL